MTRLGARRVFGMWWGGPGYSHGDFPDSLESWPTITAAGYSLRERFEMGRDWRYTPQKVALGDDGIAIPTVTESFDMPCVTFECYLDVYPAERVGRIGWRVGNEPAIRLRLGPRLGIRRENF